MIKNSVILFFNGREILCFKKASCIVFVDGINVYHLNINGVVLGCIGDSIILFLKNKYITALFFPSFVVKRILLKNKIDGHCSSRDSIWFQKNKEIYFINLNLEVILYDVFDEEIEDFFYLEDRKTLGYVFKKALGYRIVFEDTTLSSLVLYKTKTLPELSFESDKLIIFSLGRSVLEYHIQAGKIKVINNSEKIILYWKDFYIELLYDINETKVYIRSVVEKIEIIKGDVFKIFNSKYSLYFFSDSINESIQIYRIDSNGQFTLIYSECENSNLIFFEKFTNQNIHLCPMFTISPNLDHYSNYDNEQVIFFIHGGPHQKSGNVWDNLINYLIKEKYLVYIPQYTGSIGWDYSQHNKSGYGIDDFNDILQHYRRLKKKHKKVLVVGHSYGVFLAFKLYCLTDVDILFGINGVYDLITISKLIPKTFSHLSKNDLISRSCKTNFSESSLKYSWHHFQFTYDHIITQEHLMNSLHYVGNITPNLHELKFRGHGCFNEQQAKIIVEKIKSIEQSFYNSQNYIGQYQDE